ncbi:MAG: sulfur carrier protein ThiS [Desulfuromonadaceae bacterium]|jgi:thiamine biosynthesis protein ThiS
MQLIINGQPKQFAEPLNVSALLQLLRLDSAHVAVELNRQVLLQEQFDSMELNHGDRLELIQFVGGG